MQESRTKPENQIVLTHVRHPIICSPDGCVHDQGARPQLCIPPQAHEGRISEQISGPSIPQFFFACGSGLSQPSSRAWLLSSLARMCHRPGLYTQPTHPGTDSATEVTSIEMVAADKSGHYRRHMFPARMYTPPETLADPLVDKSKNNNTEHHGMSWAAEVTKTSCGCTCITSHEARAC